MERKAVYAGTFDPLTNGHLWMIEQGARIFEQLVVAVGVNPAKRCMFGLDERLEMLTYATRHMPNVSVVSFNNQFLIHYAESIKAQFILRGIRSQADYEYERTMRNVNGDIAIGITTVFLFPPRYIVEISSSMVKGLIGPEQWETVVEKYVPDFVFEHLKEVHYGIH